MKTRTRKITPDNCLSIKFPCIAKEWHTTKNGNVFPHQVSYGSHKEFFWECHKNQNHVWSASPNCRTNKNRGCPYCSGYRAAMDNCLAIKFPDIAKEWHTTKNGSLTPYDVTCGKDTSAWFVCPKGHDYFAIIKNRTINKSGCPYCSGKIVTIENSLLIRNPELCKEWDYSKNKNITPDKVLEFSSEKVFWICKNNHGYLAKISKRSGGSGCPYCSGNKVSNINSLKTKCPELCKEWDYKKNKNIMPDNISFASNKKVG